MKKVYLAGQITGLTFAEAQDGWRTHVAEILEDSGAEMMAFSPLRGKHYLRDHGPLEKQYLHLSPMSSPQGIVRRDFNDILTCDAVLANFTGATRASIGTCWEMGAAYALRKPVIVVMEPENIHDHPFITQTATYVFAELDEAIDALFYLLGE